MADPRPPRATDATDATEETHVADMAPYIDTDDQGGAGPKRGATTDTPPWVYVLGIVLAIALVVLLIVLHLSGILGPGLHGLH